MRSITRFTVLAAEEATGTCTLAIDGSALADRFDGVMIAAQYALPDDRMLLCLNDDSIYDAGLHLYLLRADGGIEDAMEAGGFLCPGYFEQRQLLDTALDFSFFTNDVVYRVNVLPQARFRFILPTGWRYKHRLRPHLLSLAEHPHRKA
jgi:hypothetical protein